MELCGPSQEDVQEIRECVYYMIDVALERVVRETKPDANVPFSRKPDQRPKHSYPPISYLTEEDKNILPHNVPKYSGKFIYSFCFRTFINY